jgi:hypothetical protein
LAGLTSNRPISVRASTCTSTVTHNASHAAPHFSRAFLSLHLTYHAVHSDLNGVHTATIHAIHFNAAKFQSFMNARQVRHVPGYSVGCF